MTIHHSINGRTIEARLLGSGSTTVLFFHGFGSSATAFPADEELLTQQGLQLLCLNRPGVGGSALLKEFSAADIMVTAFAAPTA